MEQNSVNLTKGPIVGPLIRFSLPILLALLLQALYGAVDLLVVGKFARTADVAGVAVGTLFSIGLAVPFSTVFQIIACFGFMFLLKKQPSSK
ncbi:MAG: hypothetical protein II794_03660 [Oscillospiraceae bacterium]|nr:hypothetical protein [Oscillospiraceae bacterium]